MKDVFSPPIGGARLEMKDGRIVPMDNPIVPCIVGDGIGADVTPVMIRVVDAAVKHCYGDDRQVFWWQLPAGELAAAQTGEHLPGPVVEIIRKYRVAIKGPLTTPVGRGIRSLNVQLRQSLDLYACVRPVRWYSGVPAPVTRPQDVDLVIFRENMEDLYMGVEFEAGSDAARQLISLINRLRGTPAIGEDFSIGIKPFSRYGTERIARAAMEYALARGLPSITIVHKGNIMKHTEGAFRQWVYDFYRREYGDRMIAESDLDKGSFGNGRVVVKDRITDAMFAELLLRPSEYRVILTSNLNGDYLSDAAAAQVGGLGFAPGANLSDETGIFEATHGTAPTIAGKNIANPASIILSACMMLEYLGWPEASSAIQTAITRTVGQGKVTADLAQGLAGAMTLSTSDFGQALIDNL